jgi:Protein of unknown function (DUF3500)
MTRQDDVAPPGAHREVAGHMAAAARAWLDALPGAQRGTGQRGRPRSGSPAEDDRQRWHYTPVDHGGLTLAAMGPEQRSLAMQLVASGLSSAGYVTVCTVMGLENVLDRIEGFPPARGGERLRDPGRYYLRVFGEPGGAAPWGWRLGGHHVSLNNLVVDGRVAAVTPNFLGANPAVSPLLGSGVLRPLSATEDLARDLVRSLPPAARRRAVVLDRAPADIVSGERPRLPRDGEVVRADDPADPRLDLGAGPVGLAGAEMDAGHRELLGRLLDAYTGRVPQGLVPALDLDAVHLAWAGSLEPGRPHYYRLSGPGLLVEWDDTQDDANHAHSVWRDPDGDFGLDVLAEHRALHHPG